MPPTTISPRFIEQALDSQESKVIKPSTKFVWLDSVPVVKQYVKKGKKNPVNTAALTFHNKKDAIVIHSREEWGRWLIEALPLLMVNSNAVSSFARLEQSFNDFGAGDFQHFLNSGTLTELKENGLLLL